MAIIKFAAPIDEIRGTIGGVTFSKNGAGQYAKRWTYPVVPNRMRQQSPKSIMSQCGARWLNLDSTTRTAWATWAALPANERTNSLGHTYYMTGFQAFCSVQYLWVYTFGVFRTSAPSGSQPSAPIISSFVFSHTFPYIYTSYPAGEFAGVAYVIYATVYGMNTQQPVKRGMLLVFVVTVPGATSQSISAQYSVLFGAPQVGQRCTIALHKLTNGAWLSAPTYATATCV